MSYQLVRTRRQIRTVRRRRRSAYDVRTRGPVCKRRLSQVHLTRRRRRRRRRLWALGRLTYPNGRTDGPPPRRRHPTTVARRARRHTPTAICACVSYNACVRARVCVVRFFLLFHFFPRRFFLDERIGTAPTRIIGRIFFALSFVPFPSPLQPHLFHLSHSQSLKLFLSSFCIRVNEHDACACARTESPLRRVQRGIRTVARIHNIFRTEGTVDESVLKIRDLRANRCAPTRTTRAFIVHTSSIIIVVRRSDDEGTRQTVETNRDV